MSDWSRDGRGATPVIGNILLVAVVIVLGVAMTTLAFAFLDSTGTPSADVAFEYQQSPVGLEMIPVAMGTDVVVKLNGNEVTEIEAGQAGESILLPTAPGDRISVVSQDEQRSVLVEREVDSREEIGDFIAYYTFEEANTSTVVDESGNGNHGDVNGGVTPVNSGCGSALDYDGDKGTYVDIGDLSVDGPDEVEEITIAIEYQLYSGSDIQNLIEHQDSNFAWYIETREKFDDPHRMRFDIGWKKNPSEDITTDDIPAKETQILVGTYDGSEMSFYRNGNLVGTKSLDREVALGDVILGADSDPSTVGQNLNGQLCNVRFYYAAFDSDEVQRITNAMEG